MKNLALLLLPTRGRLLAKTGRARHNPFRAQTAVWSLMSRMTVAER
jgi:hypothetical protein